VWSEALRNPALALRLRESMEAATNTLAEADRASSVRDAELAPELLANTLMCVLPGYRLQLTMRGADAVKAIPNTVRALVPIDGADQR
jgi:hypothetical protein